MPRSAVILEVRARTRRGTYGTGFASRSPEATTGAATPAARAASTTSSQKRSAARSTPSGSTPRSNRTEASVRSPSQRAVLATAGGRKEATSRSTREASEVISLDWPPMMPPIPTGRSPASQIRQSLAASGLSSLGGRLPRTRVTPSRVTISSPTRAARTRSPCPPRRSRSYGCVGWPSSSMT